MLSLGSSLEKRLQNLYLLLFLRGRKIVVQCISRVYHPSAASSLESADLLASDSGEFPHYYHAGAIGFELINLDRPRFATAALPVSDARGIAPCNFRRAEIRDKV